jgi:hypothetical protein
MRDCPTVHKFPEGSTNCEVIYRAGAPTEPETHLKAGSLVKRGTASHNSDATLYGRNQLIRRYGGLWRA